MITLRSENPLQIRIAINGLGRIGRALARQALNRNDVSLVAVNDLDPSIDNHLYLLEYDSIYGKAANFHASRDGNCATIGKNHIHFYSQSNIEDVTWELHNPDFVIDCTGSTESIRNCRSLIDKGSCKYIIITNASTSVCDNSIVLGANEEKLDIHSDRILSSSICDVNAIAPFLKVVDQEYGIEYGNITTLHPWLQYQNLLDGTVASIASASHYWEEYALGRCAVTSLIPKSTTLLSALELILPGMQHRLDAMSFRTPLPSVAAAKGTILLRKSTSLSNITDKISALSQTYSSAIRLSRKNLVSVDFKAETCGGVVDVNWLQLNHGKLLSFVIWYDNEWGYASKVYSLIDYITQARNEVS